MMLYHGRLSCRSVLRRNSYRWTSRVHAASRTTTSEASPKSSKPSRQSVVDVDELLSKDSWSWSVRTLLPDSKTSKAPTVTKAQLHHLLRLSALPIPQSETEEADMLKTLESQLHFVKDVQAVDTTGVEPLQAIRDETEAGIKERTIGVETLKEALRNEEFKGKNQRPRRRRDVKVDTRGAEDWDVLGTAEKKVGRYFVVEGGKSGEQ